MHHGEGRPHLVGDHGIELGPHGQHDLEALHCRPQGGDLLGLRLDEGHHRPQLAVVLDGLHVSNVDGSGGAFTKLPLGIGAQSGEDGEMARASGGGSGTVGSVLILVPAGVLVLMLLGAIAVDFSVAYLAKRQLEAVAGAAVNDAAGAGLDEARLRAGGGQPTLDADRVRAAALRAIEASVHGPVRLVADPEIEVVGHQVTVRLEGETAPVFAPRRFRRPARPRASSSKRRGDGVTGPVRRWSSSAVADSADPRKTASP